MTGAAPKMAITVCAFHEIEERVGVSINPTDAIMLGAVVGLRLAASGAAPKMCPECEARFEEACRLNGIVLAWMNKEDSDSVAQATGSRFVRMEETKGKGDA